MIEKPPLTLLVCHAHDCVKRGDILTREIEYLKALLDQRLGSLKEEENEESNLDAAWSGMSGTVSHLMKSAMHLKGDIQSGYEAACKLLALAKLIQRLSAPSRSSALLAVIFSIGAQRHKFAQHVSSIGELHHRLDQISKYSNPDHPSPTVRGLRDSTLADRYMAEFARYVYRDIARLAAAGCGVYPFPSTPRLYIHRQYEAESSFARFISDKDETAWVDCHQSNNQHSQDAATTHAFNKDSGLQRFASIRVPFWLPDSMELLPVIGHEIGHVVLQDICGDLFSNDWPILNNSLLADLIRNAMAIFQVAYPNDEESVARAFVEEIVSDALGLARFGGAFTYAAASLSFAHPLLSAFANDHFGHNNISVFLECVNETIDGLDCLNLWKPQDNLASEWESNRNETFFLLARLAVLSVVNEKVQPDSAGDHEKELNREVWTIVRIFSDALFSTKMDLGERDSFRYLVDGLAELVFAFIDKSPSRFREMAVDKSGNGGEKKRPVLDDYFAERQRISSDVVETWNNSKLAMSLILGENFQDVVWRKCWHEASLKGGQELAKWPQLRYALMDDYIFRTSTPAHLFTILRSANLPKKNNSETFGKLYPAAMRANVASSLDVIDHYSAVTAPSLDIKQYLLTGEAPSPDGEIRKKPFPCWDRFPLVGMDNEIIENDIPQIKFDTSIACVLTLLTLPTGNGKPTIADYCSNHNPNNGAIVLGRYDVAILETQEQQRGKKPDKIGVGYRRNMILLGSEMPNMSEVLAMSFVAMANPLAWRIFKHWFDVTLLPITGLKAAFFLSEGWEQAVVMFSPGGKNAECSPDPVFRAIESTSAHALVGRTETLFTELFFDIGVGTEYDVSVRFRCRAKVGKGLSARNLHDAIVKSTYDGKEWPLLGGQSDKIIVRIVCGLTDFEVRLHLDEKDLDVPLAVRRKVAAKHLHGVLNSCAAYVRRLQTQIAFEAV